jgi:Flp pilus assembly protein TadD
MRQLAVLYSERLGDDAKAQELGSKARQAYPRDEALAAAVGKALARRGDFGYAVQLLTEAARTRTKDASLFYHLGLAQQGLEKAAEAKAMFEKALALEPNAPFAEDAKKRLEKLQPGG